MIIRDEILKQAGLIERDALIETACRLHDVEIFSKPSASRLCGLSRAEFETELVARNLPLVILTDDMLQEDPEALEKLRVKRANEDRSAGRYPGP